MRRHTTAYGLLSIVALCSLLAAACSSPLDIDTPRDRIVEAARLPVTAARFAYNDGNPAGMLFDEETLDGEIDTTSGRLWLTGSWTVPAPLRSSVPLIRLAIVLDSVIVDGSDFGIVNGSGRNSGSMTVNLPPTPNDQEFFPDGSSATLTVRLTHDRPNRRITGTVTGLVPTMRSFGFEGTVEIEY